MKLEIRELDKRDHNKAVQYAVKGMHFDWYMDSKLLLNLYGRYFWYLSLARATQVIAAYAGDMFAGVLLAEIKGEDKKYRSFWKSFYVKVFDVLQNLFAKGGSGVYDEANREMFTRYCKQTSPDGEILFLAANPEMKAKGTGSFLLNEFARREKGKNIYLYTDNACTYQFYERRGFQRAGEKDVILKIGHKKIDLQCFLYSKAAE
ncbi:GNAT family N-acetyltransferase [Anaerostipes caccae]|uniref:GNAT family N-acetyltransferase n=1 Tax=Anaerostipes caccae TaxID=105841 RepID=UPI00101D5323|nr:GNAT family N-acetyltransferase [Anaerostipes caccae]